MVGHGGQTHLGWVCHSRAVLPCLFVCTPQIGSRQEMIFWKLVWTWLNLEFLLLSLEILTRSLTGPWIVAGRTHSMTPMKARWPFGNVLWSVVWWTFGATSIRWPRVLLGKARITPERIDLIGCPAVWAPFVSFCNFVPCPFSDHSVVHLCPVPIPRGPGRWKCNISILEDPELRSKIESFWIYWRTRQPFFPSVGEWWDKGKKVIKSLISHHCSSKASKNRQELDLLTQLAETRCWHDFRGGAPRIRLTQHCRHEQNRSCGCRLVRNGPKRGSPLQDISFALRRNVGLISGAPPSAWRMAPLFQVSATFVPRGLLFIHHYFLRSPPIPETRIFSSSIWSPPFRMRLLRPAMAHCRRMSYLLLFMEWREAKLQGSMGPSYANLFVGFIEQQFFDKFDGTKPELYRRYIDDCFGATSCSRQEFDYFITSVNSFHPALEYTWVVSECSIAFLDINVSISGNRLSTSVHYKPTDSHSYLLHSSSHPAHVKNSIPYSQFLRLRRLCSDDTDFSEKAEEMCQFFKARGYPDPVIHNSKHRAQSVHPQSAPLSSHNKLEGRIPLTLTFHPRNISVKNIILKNFKLLQHDPTTAEIFAQPLHISYKRDKNLSNFLVKSTLKSDHQPGTFKCARVRCRTCPFISNVKKISGPKRTVAITDHFSCISTNLIYCITCTLCKKIYIGETGRRLGDRFREHLRDVEINDKDASKPVARHFNLPNQSCLSILLWTQLRKGMNVSIWAKCLL